MLRRIFRKLHSMNRRSFLYILAKLHAKIIKSKQDSAKSFVYYNVAGACRLHDVLRTYTMSVYLKILSYIHIFYEAPFVHKLFKIITLCFSHYILIIDLIYYKIKQKIIIKQINRKYGSDYLLYKHNPKVIIYYINTTQK